MILVSYGLQVLGGILAFIAYFGNDVLLGDAGFDLSQRGSIALVLLTYSGTVLMLGGHATKFSAFRYTTPQRSPVDMSSKRPKPPSKALEILQAFEKLGFKRLGETHEKRPGTTDDEGTTWFMANSNGTIVLEVKQFSQTAMAQLKTIYSDDAVLEYSYPMGIKMNNSQYYSRATNNKDRGEMLKKHLMLARDLVSKHGKPRSMTDISQLIQWDHLYRERYAEFRNWNAFVSQLRDFTIVATITAVCFSIIVLI